MCAVICSCRNDGQKELFTLLCTVTSKKPFQVWSNRIVRDVCRFFFFLSPSLNQIRPLLVLLYQLNSPTFGQFKANTEVEAKPKLTVNKLHAMNKWNNANNNLTPETN